VAFTIPLKLSGTILHRGTYRRGKTCDAQDNKTLVNSLFMRDSPTPCVQRYKADEDLVLV